MLRLPDKTAGEVQKIADRKGLPFATTVKELICEYLNEREPAENPCKDRSGQPVNPIGVTDMDKITEDSLKSNPFLWAKYEFSHDSGYWQDRQKNGQGLIKDIARFVLQHGQGAHES